MEETVTSNKWRTPENTRSDGMYWDGGCKQWRSTDKAAYNRARMWVDGKYVSTADPRHFPGRYSSWEEADTARQGSPVVSTYSRVETAPGANADFDARIADRVSQQIEAIENEEGRFADGYVYLAHQRHRANLSKIGFAVKPEGRATAWNTGLPPDEEFVIRRKWYVDDRRATEKYLHGAFAAYLVPGRRELFAYHVHEAEERITYLLRGKS